MFRTPLNLFRALAVAEAISWTLLIIGLILRATADLAIATAIAGSIHGFVFLSYGATAILVSLNSRWPVAPTVLAVVSAVIPYATIPVERWLHRRGLLDGVWRTEESPSDDRRWYDGLLRWFLLRPWALILLILAAVIVLFTVLVIIGPPGGRH